MLDQKKYAQDDTFHDSIIQIIALVIHNLNLYRIRVIVCRIRIGPREGDQIAQQRLDLSRHLQILKRSHLLLLLFPTALLLVSTSCARTARLSTRRERIHIDFDAFVCG